MKVTSNFIAVIITAELLLRTALATKLRRRLALKEVARAGNDWYPYSAFPLKKCESDCDFDTDCSKGLLCFKRSANEADVPGCTGITEAFYDDDFCVDPDDAPSRLFRVGNGDYFVTEYPLAKCRGDCDDDSDCKAELKCFHRVGGFPATVPGCFGDTAFPDTDYCYDPNDEGGPTPPAPSTSPPKPAPTPTPVVPLPVVPPPPTGTGASYIEYVGNGNQLKLPLKKCQGDCDKNSDCEGDLVCYQRGAEKDIPGCRGEADNKGTDYCFDPMDIDTLTVARIGNNGEPKKYFPLAKCRGDCDKDEDCAGPLKCFQRSSSSTGGIPGCNGIPESGGTDYCYDPADENPANPPPPVTAPISPPIPPPTEKPNQPPVPAPTDAPIPAPTKPPKQPPVAAPTEPPVDPPTEPPKQPPVAAPIEPPVPPPTNDGVLTYVGDEGEPPNKFPLDRCQGDCDYDTDCKGRLKCFYRDLEPTVPGCTGVADDWTDYCYDPDDYVELSNPGNDWDPREAFPLKLCEGDCDGDSDCEGELVCHQRDEGDPVPSCVGRPVSNADYCVHPSDETAKPPIPGSFRIKMFWAEGFNWQEEFWEQEWCFICGSSGGLDCNVDDQIFISVCDDDVTWFVFENFNDEETQIQVATTNLCFELVGQRDIRLRECNPTFSRQKFGPGNGSFTGDKFELYTDVNPGCLSQQHHPRESERVFRNDCGTAREYDTSFFNKY